MYRNMPLRVLAGGAIRRNMDRKYTGHLGSLGEYMACILMAMLLASQDQIPMVVETFRVLIPVGVEEGVGESDFNYTAATTIAKATIETGQTYETRTEDECALLITTSNPVVIMNPTVTKSGDSVGGDNCNFYGLNAAVLTKDG